MAIQNTSQLRRLRNSFRYLNRQTTKNIHEFQHVVQDSASYKQVTARLRKVPVWLRVARKIYHKYGLKHLLLILVFVVYQFLGAGIFLFLEEQAEEDKEVKWRKDVLENRTHLVHTLIPAMFNNNKYLLFPNGQQSQEIYEFITESLANYTDNYVPMTDQKIHWDFWNAMLYAGTICTTIGYGHLFPRTNAGRLATMVYAFFGIPLVLSLLDDLGKLLTMALKYPWLACKMLIRRAFRHCTGQTLDEIRRIDEEDKKWLKVFDLPIPVAIGVVVAWIFVCSATFCIWEKRWDYFVAFYFFFVSLTTIGLGDIVPDQPKYLLMLFFYIIIGLSLVSMCVNLIQAKLERTYEVGRDDPDAAESVVGSGHDVETAASKPGRGTPAPPAIAALALSTATRASLGILRAGSICSTHSASSNQLNVKPPFLFNRNTCNKTCQTLLSIACPNGILERSHSAGSSSIGTHVLPTSISIDDVMKLVDTEETDMYILSHLCGDQNESNLVRDINDDQEGFGDEETLLPTPCDNDPRPSSSASRVHFRSIISLISKTAGETARLAHMDSTSIKSPETEAAKVPSPLISQTPLTSAILPQGDHVEAIIAEEEADKVSSNLVPVPNMHQRAAFYLGRQRGRSDAGTSSETPKRQWRVRFGFGSSSERSPAGERRKSSLTAALRKLIPVRPATPTTPPAGRVTPKRPSTIMGMRATRIGRKSGLYATPPGHSSIEVHHEEEEEDEGGRNPPEDDDMTPLEPKTFKR